MRRSFCSTKSQSEATVTQETHIAAIRARARRIQVERLEQLWKSHGGCSPPYPLVKQKWTGPNGEVLCDEQIASIQKRYEEARARQITKRLSLLHQAQLRFQDAMPQSREDPSKTTSTACEACCKMEFSGSELAMDDETVTNVSPCAVPTAVEIAREACERENDVSVDFSIYEVREESGFPASLNSFTESKAVMVPEVLHGNHYTIDSVDNSAIINNVHACERSVPEDVKKKDEWLQYWATEVAKGKDSDDESLYGLDLGITMDDYIGPDDLYDECGEAGL